MPEFTLQRFVGAVIVIIGFILLASVLLGLKVGGEFYYLGCEGKIGGAFVIGKGYENPRCTILTDETSCELTAYKKIEKNDAKISVCVWKPDDDGATPNCYFNSKLSCEDFSQLTSPKCQDIPDCRPVSAIKTAITRLAK